MDSITEWWLERSAIMQESGMDRADADYAAYALTIRYCRRTGQALPSDGYFYVHRNRDVVWSDEKGGVEYVKPRPGWVLWTSEHK